MGDSWWSGMGVGLRGRDPADLFRADWYNTYEEQIDLIWMQLVRMNMQMLILEHLAAFRFDLFATGLGRNHFWHLAENSFFESIILIIWRVAVDNSFHEGLTLQQLKNQMNGKFLDQADEFTFRAELRELDFERAFSVFEPTLRELRRDYVAHWNVRKLLEPTDEDLNLKTLPFGELRTIQAKLNEFFCFLCFGHQRALLPLDYDPLIVHATGTDSRPDIERLLDLVAKASPLLNLPERNFNYWRQVCRERLHEEDLEVVDRYRAKFGLSPVSPGDS